MAQLVVIDQVLVAQGYPKHPLTDQAPYAVLDQIGITVIGEAVGKPLGATDKQIRLIEVIWPPSNAATTLRPSTGVNPNRSALHSVCIGLPLVLR